jgi:hypothetical protein
VQTGEQVEEADLKRNHYDNYDIHGELISIMPPEAKKQPPQVNGVEIGAPKPDTIERDVSRVCDQEDMVGRVFVDLDGTLADFDGHYESLFGFRPCKLADNVNWGAVRSIPGFYADMPPLPDFEDTWRAVEKFEPTILTGIPASVEEAADNKTAWVRKHLGPHVPIICCRSKEKREHCTPGALLIDDWEKYKHLWLGAGGQWITHVNARRTRIELTLLGLYP